MQTNIDRDEQITKTPDSINVAISPSAIIKSLLAVSILSSVLFIVLSYLFHEVGYYLLAVVSLITLYFSVTALPGKNKEPNPFLIFVLSVSYQLLIVLLASVVVSYQGLPYALIAITLALILSSTIPRSSISDWVVTAGVLGAIASVQFSLLAFLPQLINQAISSIILIIAVLLLIKVTEMLGERRIIVSIRTKLLLISLALVLTPLIILSVINSRFLQRSIQTQANESLRAAAVRAVDSIDGFLLDRQSALSNESTMRVAKEYLNLPPNARVNSTEESALAQTFNALGERDRDNPPSYAVLDYSGAVLLDTGSPSAEVSDGNSVYLQEAARTGNGVVTPVLFAHGALTGKIKIITPIKDSSSSVIGFLQASYNSSVLQSLLVSSAGHLERGSYPILLDENGLRLADALSPDDVNRLISPVSADEFDQLVAEQRVPNTIPYAEIAVVQPDLTGALAEADNSPYFSANLKVNNDLVSFSGSSAASQQKPWTVVYLQENAVLSATLNNQNRLSTTIGLLVAAIISLFVVFASSRFSKPIIELTQAAEKIAAGDLSVQAQVTSHDEIGTLGTSFNSMTMQLKALVGSLENQVQERTYQLAEQNEVLQLRSRQLQTVADVARSIVSTRQVGLLLDQVTELVSERFGFYHTGIFLLDETAEFAELRATNSHGGKAMLDSGYKLKVGLDGLVGYVTGTGEPRIATNIGADSSFFNSPQLPETQSEMALPLKLGGEIIGALDVQSIEKDAFSQEDVTLFTTLADQISVAIENANAYEISQQTVEEMKELDRVKSQFLANMSHELRTPLNSVIGFSRVILKGIDGPINETQAQDITAIYNSGLHLLNMINEILDQSKIEAGKMELQTGEMSVQQVVAHAVETTTGLLKDKPIHLVTEIAPDLPLIDADEVRVEQILFNLISNAAKFTEQGSITISADKILTSQNREEIVIKVADTGIGIDPKNQAKLFQQFSQVDDSSTRRTGGTGLGLSISRSLVELHGGQIGIERSAPGEGSVFYFTLPVNKDEPPIEEEIAFEGHDVVLAIDDDAQVITLYQRFLKPYGYDVVALTDPKQAVQRAKELQPFAITLDVMMPEKDGWQVLNELKNDEETRNIPVMVCSILEEMEKGFNLGASDYLVKPFIHNELVNSIKRLSKEKDIRDILIIDDDPQYLLLLKGLLENEGGYHTVIAEGGLAALKQLESFTPDAILMDLVLDDISGFELLDKINSEPRLKQIPVIILASDTLNADQIIELGEIGNQIFSKYAITKKELLENLQDSLGRLKRGVSA